MAIRSLKNGTFSRSLLVGNSYYIPPAYEWIASQTLSSSSSSVVFSSIPQNYKHLQIRMIAGDNTQTNNTFGLQFNSDTGSNYASHGLRGNGSTVSTNANTSQTGSYFFSVGGSTNWGTAIIDIHDYASTTKNKTIRTLAGYDANGSGIIGLGSGLWLNTNAINSINIHYMTFAPSSKFMLFGIKAGA